MFLLCLLFPAVELFALDSNDKQQSIKQLKIGVPEINLPKMSNIRSSLNNTLNRASVSLSGTKSRIKNSFDGTMCSIRKSFNGTMDSIDEFFADAGDIADVAAVAGAMFIYIMAATEDNCYYYDYNYNYNWNGSYDHSYPRSYDPWR